MLVSVIMPIYNGEKYISESIMSVLKQSYQELELILINDGSSDESENVAFRIISENYGRKIRYINQENCGIAEARNRGIKEAKGEYVCFIDQDDQMEADCLKKLMQEAVESDADIVIGGVNKVNGAGKIIKTVRFRRH